MTIFLCKMILGKSQEGTETCSFIDFVGKTLLRIKVSCEPKSPPSPAWCSVKYKTISVFWKGHL